MIYSCLLEKANESIKSCFAIFCGTWCLLLGSEFADVSKNESTPLSRKRNQTYPCRGI